MIEVGSREWIRATLALSLGSFLVFLNLYQTHPLLPLLAEVFSVSSLSAGWTLAGCTAGLAVSLLVCARLADRFGRRRIMLWSLAGAILLSLLISLVSQFEQLLLLRILQGSCWRGCPPPPSPTWGKSSASGPCSPPSGSTSPPTRWGHRRPGGRRSAGRLV